VDFRVSGEHEEKCGSSYRSIINHIVKGWALIQLQLTTIKIAKFVAKLISKIAAILSE